MVEKDHPTAGQGEEWSWGEKEYERIIGKDRNFCRKATIFFDFVCRFVIFVVMGNIKSVLRELYPGRDTYTDEELATARRVMLASLGRTPRSARLPSIFIPIGGEYVSGGVRYRCVKRPRVVPRDCCIGCDFSESKRGCPAALQCSKFDRRDHTFVWFVEVVE